MQVWANEQVGILDKSEYTHDRKCHAECPRVSSLHSEMSKAFVLIFILQRFGDMHVICHFLSLQQCESNVSQGQHEKPELFGVLADHHL